MKPVSKHIFRPLTRGIIIKCLAAGAFAGILKTGARASGMGDWSGMVVAMWHMLAGSVSALAVLIFILISKNHAFLRPRTAVLWLVLFISSTVLALGINKQGSVDADTGYLLTAIYPLVWLPSLILFRKDTGPRAVWMASCVAVVIFMVAMLLVELLT